MHFLDDEDNEVMQKELKEAFRLYDKDGECTTDRPKYQAILKIKSKLRVCLLLYTYYTNIFRYCNVVSLEFLHF
jgi:hypothetical protein